MMMCIYWGCLGRAGHFLYESEHRTLRDFECDRLHIPRDYQLDGSYLFLPRPEKSGAGCLTYLPATDRTILAWWGSKWDGRGAVNSAIITEGNVSADECWSRFIAKFPASLTDQMQKPSIGDGA